MNKTTNARIKALLPGGIPRWVRVYDNGGESADRYTVVFTGRYDKGPRPGREFSYLAMSGAPFHPQGVGLHGSTENRPADVTLEGPSGYRWPPALGRKCHLGTRVSFTSLPADCQQLALQDYIALWDIEDVAPCRHVCERCGGIFWRAIPGDLVRAAGKTPYKLCAACERGQVPCPVCKTYMPRGGECPTPQDHKEARGA
jgi:hypothetical protein